LRELIWHSLFKKEFNKQKKQLTFEDFEIFFNVIIYSLRNDIPLDKKYKDHSLIGDYKNFRECHFKPDLLLVYTKEEGKLILARFNTHSELFG
jgi:YafQ family addiction module toxin component